MNKKNVLRIIYSAKYGKLKMSDMSHFLVGHRCPTWAIFTLDTSVPRAMKMARVG